ncbi:MAG: D-alanyl-D-alanine carboxypeptidase family protein [Pseudomonadota bacterium]
MAWRIPLLAALVVVYGSRALSDAPDAAVVMDARTGEVLLAENADTPLHPASLTKMMTLYVVFAALNAGEVSWNAPVRISERAATLSGARFGLRAGQSVPLGALVRATAIGSANDAAVALSEAVAGSETAFVARMNATAQVMGLRGTSFRNAHGLTATQHLSTARDMSVLGWRLLWDFPDHAGLYARLSADIVGRRVAHTNRRFLNAYAGANGIKTGYTRAAGFTLTASAVRGRKHLIVTVLGAASSSERAARAARLMDWGFARVDGTAPARPPPPLGIPILPAAPESSPGPPELLVSATPLGAGRSVRPLADWRSPPQARVGRAPGAAESRAPPSFIRAPSLPTPAPSPGGLALTGLVASPPSFEAMH